MKKLLLLTLLFTITITNSQQKGTWVFGGEVGFSNNKIEDIQTNNATGETKQFSIATRTGYIFTDTNFEIGIGFGYGTYEEDTFNFNFGDNHTYITTAIAPYFKKYFPLNEKFAFHILGEIGYRKTYRENSTNTNEIDIQEYNFVLRPGFEYFMTKHIALTANIGSFGYAAETSKYQNSSDSKSDTFGFNMSTANMMFGVAYYL